MIKYISHVVMIMIPVHNKLFTFLEKLIPNSSPVKVYFN